MSNKDEKKCNKKARSFSPDEVVLHLHQALQIDLDRNFQFGQADTTIFFKRKMIDEFTKKYEPEEVEEAKLDKEAYDKFKNICSHIRSCNDPDRNIRDLRYATKFSTKSERVLNRAQSFIGLILGPLCIEEMFDAAKHGPGTTIGTKFCKTTSTDKLTFPISCTAVVKDLFMTHCRFDPGFSGSILAVNMGDTVSPVLKVVEGSRTTTVSKTATAKRLIAVEPTLNMFYQQGLMNIMVKRLKLFGLDLESLQDRHKYLAEKASVFGESATIDFSSASDTISLSLAKFLLPADWYEILCLVRCSSTKLGSEFIKLPMISTMGNATTFPLETLVFYAIALSSLYEDEGHTSFLFNDELENENLVSVFGDDVILPTKNVSTFLEVSEHVGFIVNREKSCFDDNVLTFRESCGGDFYCGIDVRAFHVRKPVNQRISGLEPWLYIIVNRLLERYISYFQGDYDMLCNTQVIRYIVGLLNQFRIEVKFVPDYYPDDSGIKCLLDVDVPRLFVNVDSITPIYINEQGSLAFSYLSFKYLDPEADAINQLRWEDIDLPFNRFEFKSELLSYRENLQSRRHVEIPLRVGKFKTNYWVEERDTSFFELYPTRPHTLFPKGKVDGHYVVKKGHSSCMTFEFSRFKRSKFNLEKFKEASSMRNAFCQDSFVTYPDFDDAWVMTSLILVWGEFIAYKK